MAAKDMEEQEINIGLTMPHRPGAYILFHHGQAKGG